MTRWISCLCAALLLMGTQVSAEIDRDRMKRDLTIMESVLARFFDIDNEDVSGFYLPGKGVVLLTRNTAPDVDNIRVHSSRDHDTEKKVHQIKIKMNKQQGERADQVKQKLAEFLSTYADAIGQLKADERVTVLVLPSRDFEMNFPDLNRHRVIHEQAETNGEDTIRVEKRIYRTPPSKLRDIEIEEIVGTEAYDHLEQALEKYENKGIRIRASHASEDGNLEVSVAKRDIDAIGRGKIDRETFMNRIAFRDSQIDPALAKKIQVMADILDTTLEQNGGEHGFMGNTKSTGIYLQSLGAIFFTTQQQHYFHWIHEASAQTQPEDPIEKLKSELVTAVADYGATLRGLKSDEWIVVHLDLGNRRTPPFVHVLHQEDVKPDVTTSRKTPQRILLRVQKKYTEAYAVGKLDLDAFREKVIITEM